MENLEPKGDLTSVTEWNDGIQMTAGQELFWKKILLLNKKSEAKQGDNKE